MKKTETKAASAPTPPAAAPAPAAPPAAPVAGFDTPVPGKYSLADLQGDAPAGVEPHGKEKWLSDADFMTALKMSRDDYNKLPAWKQNNAKKAAGIF